MGPAVQNKEALLRLFNTHRSEIKAYGVKYLGLFGSFARGSAIHPGSDVDLLIEFEPGRKTYDNFLELALYLEALLGRRVELVTRESLSPYIGPHILKQVEDAGL
jgi:uncharacterized protein